MAKKPFNSKFVYLILLGTIKQAEETWIKDLEASFNTKLSIQEREKVYKMLTKSKNRPVYAFFKGSNDKKWTLTKIKKVLISDEKTNKLSIVNYENLANINPDDKYYLKGDKTKGIYTLDAEQGPIRVVKKIAHSSLINKENSEINTLVEGGLNQSVANQLNLAASKGLHSITVAEKRLTSDEVDYLKSLDYQIGQDLEAKKYTISWT